MVRWLWQNRLVQGLVRFVRLFVRWILVWLSFLLRKANRSLLVTKRFILFLVRPRDPNNVFVSGREGSFQADEMALSSVEPELESGRRATLLWAAQAQELLSPDTPLDTSAVSLWKGDQQVSAEDSAQGTAYANRRYSYLDVLAAQIKRLSLTDIRELEALVQRLARKWLDIDQSFEWLPRRNRLDVGKTLRYNIPRYAGRILNFKWATKERPIPQLSKPARILVIGDVSHSMVHYVSVTLYFFHMLNFRFVVDSYVFSEKATHSTPYLNGLGTFEEKVQRLVNGAKSWNAGTRFGSALEEIAKHAVIDEHTYVIIATDGKVSLQADEANKIDRYMHELRSKAKQIVFVTPSAEFSDGASGKTQPQKLGSFKYDFFDIPIFSMGPPLWYGTLSRYADRLYLVRTVQDLIDMTEDLILASRG